MLQLHHNLPQAADDYARDTRTALTVLLGATNMNTTAEAPVTSPSLYVNGRSEPMWRRVVQPTQIPDWISEEEFSYYVTEFERHGWEGGLNWYRVLDLNWHATPQLDGAKVAVPTAFVAGTKDIGVTMNGGTDKVRRTLAKVCALPVEITFLENAGHWIQQERAKEINELLVAFVRKHRSRFDHTSDISTRGVTKSTTSAHKFVSRM